VSKRKERRQQFTTRATFAIFSFAQDLINSAFVLLQLASNERKGTHVEKAGGHYSIHAPGSIVLICTAFDQWLNQSALTLDVRYPGLVAIAADHDTITKYQKFGQTIAASDFEVPSDLRVVWDVRNEIVHWLPRKAAEVSNWPEWLSALQERGLVLATVLPDGTDATDLATKFHSYSLARWVWQALYQAATALLAQFPEGDEIERGTMEMSVEGFRAFEHLPE